MKILRTKRNVYRVVQNEDGTLTMSIISPIITKNQIEYIPAHNAGSVISGIGGIDTVLARCKEEDDVEVLQKAKMDYEYHKEKEAKAKKERDEYYATLEKSFQTMIGKEVEATDESLSIFLGYLNTMNWGLWLLHDWNIRFTSNGKCINYSCQQYSNGPGANSHCTVIKFDKEITVSGWKGKRFGLGDSWAMPNNTKQLSYRDIIFYE
ncbi:MAG: hypothetical protein ACOCNX_00735 [Prevotella sp.]